MRHLNKSGGRPCRKPIYGYRLAEPSTDSGCRRPGSRRHVHQPGKSCGKSDLNALYFATYQLPRPRGWNEPFTVGHYWRAALVVFFNYGVDTGTVFKSGGFHEPILWRHVSWRPEPPNGQGRESRYGWLYYRRVKTKKQFYRPMNRVVQAHLKSIRPADPQPEQPVSDCWRASPLSKDSWSLYTYKVGKTSSTRLERIWRPKANAQCWADLIDTRRLGPRRTNTGGRIS